MRESTNLIGSEMNDSINTVVIYDINSDQAGVFMDIELGHIQIIKGSVETLDHLEIECPEQQDRIF